MTDERGQERDERDDVPGGERAEHASLTVHETVGEDPERGAGSQVEELSAELDALNDRHLRLAAEFDNYRKRNERERESLAARLQVNLVRSMLDVLDDLERVTTTESAGAEAVMEGARLVEKKLRTSLGAAGLEEVEAEGQPFDPAVMEALMTVPTEDPAQDGRVADVFQKGYRFRDVLVRPARVRVAKHEAEGE